VQKSRKGYVAVLGFPLTSVLGLAVTLLWLRAQVPNIMFSGLGFPSPTHKEDRGVQQLSSGLLQSLLGLLYKSYSDSTPFQEALRVLRFSHSFYPAITSQNGVMLWHSKSFSAERFRKKGHVETSQERKVPAKLEFNLYTTKILHT
jgi:hypothetical protein